MLRIVNQGGGEVNPGNVIVNYTAGAHTVNLENKNSVGDCDLDAAATVTSTSADCGGHIEIRGISDNIEAVSTGLETGDVPDILVEFASISDAATGGGIKSDDGKVDVIFGNGRRGKRHQPEFRRGREHRRGRRDGSSIYPTICEGRG